MSDPPASPGSSLAMQSRAGRRVTRRWAVQTATAARSSSAVLILMTASVISAIAAAIGLTEWVPIMAAITAVISGLSLLRSNVVVPARTRMAEDATAQLLWGAASFMLDGETQYLYTGTCFQIAPGRWMAAADLAQDEDFDVLVRVRVADQWHDAEIVHIDIEKNLAVLMTAAEVSGVAKLARSLPAPGTRITVVGWAGTARDDSPTRATIEYVVQAPVSKNSIVLTGPTAPPRGFGSAPAIDISTGRVVGLVGGAPPRKRNAHRADTLNVVYVVPLSGLTPGFQ